MQITAETKVSVVIFLVFKKIPTIITVIQVISVAVITRKEKAA